MNLILLQPSPSTDPTCHLIRLGLSLPFSLFLALSLWLLVSWLIGQLVPIVEQLKSDPVISISTAPPRHETLYTVITHPGRKTVLCLSRLVVVAEAVLLFYR